MSQAMRTRPSVLLGVVDSWVAFCLDRACWVFATEVENEQQTAVNRLPPSAKESAHTRARQRVLDQYLGITPAEQPQRFRSVG
jgi:hypothetical protein